MIVPSGFLTSLGQSSYGSQIGDQMLSADLGTTIRKINGEVWGRSGTFFSPSSYPTAATIPYLKAVGNQSTQTTSYGGITYGDIATDGAGKWVIAYGDATNVLVATDNGATFTAVAHNAGGVVTSVSYDSTNGVFIAAGNSATAFFVSSATAASVGSAWTARTGSVIVGATANTAKVRSIGGVSVIVCGGGTTGNASRSTNGTTWSAINLATSLSTLAGQITLVPLGSNIWVAAGDIGGTHQRSTDNGLTFSNTTFPSSLAISGMAKAGSLIYIVDSLGNFYSSSTGATGSWTTIGKTLGSNFIPFTAVGGALQSDGVNLYCPLSPISGNVDGRLAISNDCVNWINKTIINRSWSDGATSSVKSIIGVDANGNFVLSPLSSNRGACYGNFNVTTGIGVPSSITSSASSIQTLTSYVRLA